MAYKGQKQTKYTPEFKIKIAEAYLSKEYGGYKRCAEYHGLRDTRQLRYWVKLYRSKGGMDLLLNEQRGRSTKKHNLDTMSLEEQVKYLKMEVDILKKAKALQKD